MGSSPPGSSVRGISRQEHWSVLPRPPPGASQPRARTQSLMKGILILEEILDFGGFGLSWQAVVSVFLPEHPLLCF